MSTPLLQFQQVVFQWPDGSTPILPEMTLTLVAGHTYLLDEPSGRGKSTFLRLVAGLLKPTRGKILRFTKKIGLAFQDQRLLPWLTARQNLTIAMPHANEKRVTEFLERVGLVEKAEHAADTLSGGEAQRINLLRAIISNPDLLLLDEPYNGLDEHNAKICTNLIHEWLQDSPIHGLVIATHVPISQKFCNVEKIQISTNS